MGFHSYKIKNNEWVRKAFPIYIWKQKKKTVSVWCPWLTIQIKAPVGVSTQKICVATWMHSRSVSVHSTETENCKFYIDFILCRILGGKTALELDRDLSSVIRHFFPLHIVNVFCIMACTFLLLWKHNNIIFVVLGNTDATPNSGCTSLDGCLFSFLSKKSSIPSCTWNNRGSCDY